MFMWITARTVHSGKEEEFRRTWEGFLEGGDVPGLISVQYAVQFDDPRRVLGISIWESREACDSYRSSQLENERSQRMNSLVESVDFSNYYEAEEIDV